MCTTWAIHNGISTRNQLAKNGFQVKFTGPQSGLGINIAVHSAIIE